MLVSINHRCGSGLYEIAALRVLLKCGFWEWKPDILECYVALHHQTKFDMNYLIWSQSKFLLLKKNWKSLYFFIHQRSRNTTEIFLRCILPPEHILPYSTFHGVMVSKKTLNRDSKPEDWASSVNFLNMLLSEFTYLSKIKAFCKECDDVPAQPSQLKLPSGPLLPSCFSAFLPGRPFAALPEQFYRLSWDIFYFPIQWGFIEWGGKRSEEGRGFLFWFLWGLWDLVDFWRLKYAILGRHFQVYFPNSS